MLVLARKPGETILLRRGNELITIMLSRVGGISARVGVQADQSWRIVRGEIDDGFVQVQQKCSAQSFDSGGVPTQSESVQI